MSVDEQVSYSRQVDFCDPQRASETHVTIIGLGTVGSNAAVELARLGVGGLHLVDADAVEAHNLPSQRYGTADLGVAKTEACVAQVTAVNDGVAVTSHEGFLQGGESLPDGPVVLAVDSMDARKAILDMSLAWRPNHPLVIDARMAGQALQLFAIDPSRAEELERWQGFWFPPEEAHPVPCGGRSVSYIGAICGGLIAAHLRRQIMGEAIPFLTTMDLGAMLLTVTRKQSVGA